MVVLTKDLQTLRGFITHNKNLKCRVHPLVPITILDAFSRNKEEKVVGTLLGYMSEGNIAEIVDCYAVAHNEQSDGESSTVLLDQEYHRKMAKMKSLVHNKEVVLGWFSCTKNANSQIGEKTVQIQQFYADKKSSNFNASTAGFASPLYLEVNVGNLHKKQYIENLINGEDGDGQATTGAMDGVQRKVYTSYQTPTPSAGVAIKLHQFHEVPISESSYSEESSKHIVAMVLQAKANEHGVASASQSTPSTSSQGAGATTELEKIDLFVRSLNDLQALLKEAKQYTQRVVAGEEEGQAEIGR